MSPRAWLTLINAALVVVNVAGYALNNGRWPHVVVAIGLMFTVGWDVGEWRNRAREKEARAAGLLEAASLVGDHTIRFMILDRATEAARNS